MALILCSWFFKKTHIIRAINVAGTSLSLYYAIMTQTWPTAILNGSLLIVNTIFLIRYFAGKAKAKAKEDE